MQYQTHINFMPSLRNFYLKNGNYRKAANKVLAAWAKSQNQHIFKDTQVFQGFNLTNHGENRIQYCRKYDLHNASRLVTQQGEDICTFLFVGTHEEVEEWLDTNRGLTEDRFEPALPALSLTTSHLSVSLPSKYTKSYLQQLRTTIDTLKLELAQYKDSFQDIDISSKNYNDEARKSLVNQFAMQNASAFKNQLSTIKQLTKVKNTTKAIEQAETLELFTVFINTKLIYIKTLQEYLDVSKNLH
ncbi:hypothetical protein [uncultured Thiothrix sp.]|jgi:hypothetical protein|uniref:hypothetical protein n=1 Tax=uncultured Thiothrix sp. TaxID=223185 RepID=UPI0026186989|nr:hypothetical protein [uncultured Thiothrix sp.]HMT92527.1 hypothetical protein [Thiolinea sp.]